MVIVRPFDASSSSLQAPPSPVREPSLTAGDNPLKSNPELVALLKKLGPITKYKTFHRWKKILDCLLPQIVVDNQQSMALADEASDKFEGLTAKTAQQAQNVVDCSGGSAVQANLALRELSKVLSQTTDALTDWIPATADHENEAGFTKFHLGAALIQQGFPQYVTMLGVADALTQIEENVLPKSADRQLLAIFNAYRKQVQRFCDIMADLGLYEIMKKCLEFAVAPEVEESSDEEIMEIIVECLDNNDGQPSAIVLQVEPSENIASVMDAVENEFGIPPSQLVLRYQGQALQNQPNTTLGKLGIQDGETLMASLRRISLVVHAYGSAPKEIPLNATYRDTLRDLKDMVEPASGIAVPDQRMFRRDRRELNRDEKTVKDYGFADKEHLYLEPTSIALTIQVPDLDQSFDIELSLDNTSDDILGEIENNTSMEATQFTAWIKKTSKELPTQTTTIRDMRLQNGDVLNLDLNKMNLVVHCYASDKTIPVQVTYADTLQDIKKAIERPSGIDVKSQRLFRNQKGKHELTDNAQTVQEYRFEDQEHLYLEPPSIALTIRVPELDQCFDIVLCLDDTSDDILGEIAENTGMDVKQFRTWIEKTKKELPTVTTTIRDMKLQDGEVLNVDPNKVNLFVHCYGTDKTIPVQVRCADTLQHIKKAVERPSGVDAKYQRLFRYQMGKQELTENSQTVQEYGFEDQEHLYLEPPSIALTIRVPELNQCFDVVLSLDDTSDDILGEIADNAGMNVPQFTTWLKKTNKAQPTQKTTIREMKLQDGDVLNVDLKKVNLVVYCYGTDKAIPVQAKYTDALKDIKNAVEHPSGIDVMDQRLFRNQGTHELSDNAQTVQDYGFADQEHLYLEPASVTVRVDVPELNQSFDVELGLDDKTEEIQDKIAKKTGITTPQFTTSYNGNKELPARATVRDLKLQDGDGLKVVLSRINLLVHIYGSKTDKAIPIEVTFRDTLKEIKKAVERPSGIASNRQRLLREKTGMNEMTDNARTVNDYELEDQEHLYLEPPSIQLRVQVPELNQSFDLALGLDDTSEDIRAKISDQTGLDDVAQFATLVETNKELPEHKTVRDLKLFDGDILNVKLNKVPVTVKRKGDGSKVAQLLLHPTKDSVSTIKEKVEDASGIEPGKQMLSLGSEVLDDESLTPLAIGLKPHSIIFLDVGPVVINSSGEVYVSFNINKIKEGPNDREYRELAKVTQDFYTRHLRKRYNGSFQTITVECHRGLFEAAIPSASYNVYVEWDLTARFDASVEGGVIPSRHDLCTSLVEADLSRYLSKVSKMPTRSFSKTRGVYTEQTK